MSRVASVATTAAKPPADAGSATRSPIPVKEVSP